MRGRLTISTLVVIAIAAALVAVPGHSEQSAAGSPALIIPSTLPSGLSPASWAKALGSGYKAGSPQRGITNDTAPSRADWMAEGDHRLAKFGVSVGTAGDVNGDGFEDVIVGASGFDQHRALVYQGSASGLATTPAWIAEGDLEDAWFGYSVGTAGDVNGDGFDDVIVGAPYFNGGQGFGRAFVYQGSASGLATTPAWIIEGDKAGGLLGFSVGTAGDVNGDGFDDVIVGAPTYDHGQSMEGVAFAYHGSPSGLSLTPAWTAESDQKNSRFGTSVGNAGDVNGDGFEDVILGASYYRNGQTAEGRAFAFHGSPSGLSPSSAWTAESDQSWALFGRSVGAAGDVNGDGFGDVIVGALYYTNGQIDEGRAFAYHGSASGLSTTPTWTAEGDQEDAQFGTSVGNAGDVNGDGFGDVIVGAPYYDNNQPREGQAIVYRGSASGLRGMSRAAESDQARAYFGTSVGNAGDVNGDGFGDVIVGAPYYDNDQRDDGRAFAWYG